MRPAASLLRVSPVAVVAAIAAACGSPSAPVSPSTAPDVASHGVAVTALPPATSAASLSGTANAATTAPHFATVGAVRLAMLAVRSETGCSQYDYYPDGGIQNLWCHRPLDFTFASLANEAKVAVFSSGPHRPDALRLDEREDFGHYNPAFVHWLSGSIVPPRDDEFRVRSQPMYDSAASHLAKVFWRVHNQITADRACFDREASAYAAAIAAHKLPADYYERWFYFMNPHFCEHEAAQAKKAPGKLPPAPDLVWYGARGLDGGVDGNVGKTVVGFWIRRSLDGTFDAFSELLDKVVASYDPELARDTAVANPPQLTVP